MRVLISVDELGAKAEAFTMVVMTAGGTALTEPKAVSLGKFKHILLVRCAVNTYMLYLHQGKNI